jgi:hypothetical protein
MCFGGSDIQLTDEDFGPLPDLDISSGETLGYQMTDVRRYGTGLSSGVGLMDSGLARKPRSTSLLRAG